MSARAFIIAAVLCAACVKRAGGAEEDHSAKIAGGNVLTAAGGGVGSRVGSAVHIQITFKDGSPSCVMHGAVQDARDTAHRWVWLEAGEGCPSWLTGRWWAELASGGSGWYVQNISTTPVEGSR